MYQASKQESTVKATSHSTISMREQRATSRIQRNNYHHGSCGPSLTDKTSSVSLIFTHRTHRNVKNRWNEYPGCSSFSDPGMMTPELAGGKVCGRFQPLGSNLGPLASQPCASTFRTSMLTIQNYFKETEK